MMTEDWLVRLYNLAYRFPHLGVTADLASLSMAELWGLYCYLRRLAGE